MAAEKSADKRTWRGAMVIFSPAKVFLQFSLRNRKGVIKRILTKRTNERTCL